VTDDEPAGRPPGRPARSRWALPLGIAALILAASIAPTSGGDALPVVPLGADAWLHVTGYAALSVTLSRALAAGSRRIPPAVGLAAVAAVAFGAGVELLQTAVPTRGFSWSDIVANAVGSALGGVGWWRSRRRYAPREDRPDR